MKYFYIVLVILPVILVVNIFYYSSTNVLHNINDEGFSENENDSVLVSGLGIGLGPEIDSSGSNILENYAIDNEKQLICYWGTWSVYRQDYAKFQIENVDPHLCTHLVYAFTKIENGRIKAYDPYLDLAEDWGRGNFEKFNKLRQQNPKLKTIIAIGGWNEGSEKYSQMAKTKSSRNIFIQSVVEFLKKYKFNGFDLDWEYPANRGGVPEDKENFVELVKELRQAFDGQKEKYILTAAVSAGQGTIDKAYNIPEISKYFDYISIMAYDFHGGWEKITGHHTQLYGYPNDTDPTFNVAYAVNYWLKQGAPASKLLLGMGTYGRGWLVNNEKNNGIHAPADNLIPQGLTGEAGNWGYTELCRKIKNSEGGKWTVVRNKYYQAPYATNGRNWIGYDDPKSLQIKTEFALEKNLAGAMVWSIDTDDFHGECHGEKFGLIKTIKRALNAGSFSPHPEPPPEPGTEESSTIDDNDNLVEETSTTTIGHEIDENTTHRLEDPDIVFEIMTPESSNVIESSTKIPTETHGGICKKPGLNPDPEGNCIVFYDCIDRNGSWDIYKFNCAPGTAFDKDRKICVHASELNNDCSNIV